MEKLNSRFALHSFAVFILLFINLFSSSSLLAQSETVIFSEDLRPLRIRSLQVNSDNVKYQTHAKTIQKFYHILLQDMKLAFYPLGVYYVYSDVDKELIKTDYVSGKNGSFDKIITRDGQVIASKISQENSTTVKYKNLQSGKNESLPLSDLSIILYKNGDYKIIDDIARVADILLEVNPEITALEDATFIKDKPVIEDSSITSDLNLPEDNVTSPVDKKEFERKALAKTKDLETYIRIIANKKTKFYKANEAIDAAMKLFLDEESIMEVSSKNRSVVNRFPVRTYLGKVKNLKYEDVRISWSDISYISEIRMGTSGNYYGTVVLKQKFEGMIDNQVAYTDITTKKMTVILKTYEKYVAGEKHTLWDVFLGDIGVVQTD